MALTLEEYASRWPRDEAMARAYLSGAYTMREIAAYYQVHYMTVSRAVRRLREMLEC
jgi:transposase